MGDVERFLQERAGVLAEELSAGVRQGRTMEWLEEAVLSALHDAVARERARCVALAEQRAATWERSGRGFESASWPAAALSEARARRNEALSIADAIRSGASAQPDQAQAAGPTPAA